MAFKESASQKVSEPRLAPPRVEHWYAHILLFADANLAFAVLSVPYLG